MGYNATTTTACGIFDINDNSKVLNETDMYANQLVKTLQIFQTLSWISGWIWQEFKIKSK